MSDNFYDWNSYFTARSSVYGNIEDADLLAKAKQAFDAKYNQTGDINLAGAAADAILQDAWQLVRAEIDDDNNDNNNSNNNKWPSSDIPSTNNNPYDNSWRDYDRDRRNKADRQAQNAANANANKNKPTSSNSSSSSNITFSRWISPAEQRIPELETAIWEAPNKKTRTDAINAYNANYEQLPPDAKRKYKKYKSGGLVDYTGLAQVDGTPAHPESFLNAEQTQLLSTYLLNKKDSLLTIAQDLVQKMREPTNNLATLYKTDNGNVTIEHLDVNVSVEKIANDYDARAIGDLVMDEMLKIARKSGTRGLNRR